MEKQEFAELSAFLAVVRHGTFARGALHLGVSPSALSQTIRRLEGRLGVRLLNRTTRSVSTTAAGERLATRLGPALAELDASVHALAEERDVTTGIVRINAPKLVALRMLGPHLAKFHAAYPGIVLDVTTDDTYTDIVAHRFDIGIRLGESLSKDMVAVRIGPDLRMAAVASPGYLKKHGTPRAPNDLKAHACINWRRPSSGAIYRWELERRGRSFSIEVDGPIVTNDPAVMLAAALQGLGIAYLSDAEVAEHVERGRLVQVLAPWSPRFEGFFLYYPHRQPLGSPARAFVEFFRKALAAEGRASASGAAR